MTPTFREKDANGASSFDDPATRLESGDDRDETTPDATAAGRGQLDEPNPRRIGIDSTDLLQSEGRLETTGVSPDNAAAWDEISDWYQSTYQLSTASAQYGPLCPDEAELRLCGDIANKRVLELGCGGGQSSIAFARQGAHVIGVDISEAQIRHARRLAEREEVKVEFKVGDLANLAFVQAGSIDLVFSAFALQYVERFDRLCRSVERVLAHHGLFVFSQDHPFWDCVDRGSGALTRSYFDGSPMDWRWNGDASMPIMRTYHRTITEIVTSLCRAGLEIETLLEPEPLNDPASSWTRSYPLELMRLLPATLIVRARKVS